MFPKPMFCRGLPLAVFLAEPFHAVEDGDDPRRKPERGGGARGDRREADLEESDLLQVAMWIAPRR
jgi:hypothetical protein